MHQEPNKSILIIKSEYGPLLNAEKFLAKRDWTVHVTAKLDEAILFISRHQPQFVMVCVDHSNKNIKAFIKMLLPNFPNRVIVFADKAHVLTYHRFNETGAIHHIYPPVSGPAIERVMLAYYKIQMSTTPMNMQLFKGNRYEKSPVYAYWSHAKAVKPAASVTLSVDKTKEMLKVLKEDSSPLLKGQGTVTPISASGETRHHLEKRDLTGQVQQKSDENSDQAVVHERSQKDLHGKTDGFSMERAQVGSVSARSTEESVGVVSTTKPAESAPGLVEQVIRLNEHEHDSLISRATLDALDRTVVKGYVGEVEAVQDSSKMSCIVVESTRFSGYLVAALGKNRELDEDFVAHLRERLFMYLEENGEDINEANQSMRLTLKKVDFKKWAVKEAEFLRRSVHAQEEVSLAFFPRRLVRLELEDSTDERMAKVKMADLAPDVPVEFDLYLYLEENEKYLKYTKKGSKFLSSQKSRLESQGMKFMHIFKDQIPEFNKYRAQNFLNEKIERFESEANAA